MSDQKIKTAAAKAPMGLIPGKAIIGAARVFGYGARKYAPGNFHSADLSDGAGQRYISAALRHLAEMQEPNGLHTPESLAALDPESGLPHLDHVLCGLMMLRAIMVKGGALAEDPGVGLDPPSIAPALEPVLAAEIADLPCERFEIVARNDVAGRPARFYGEEYGAEDLAQMLHLYNTGDLAFSADVPLHFPVGQGWIHAIVDNGAP